METTRKRNGVQRIVRTFLVLSVVALMVSLAHVSFVSRATKAYDASNLIRLHVVANSDRQLDQEVKLRVRDEILRYLEPSLVSVHSKDEARSIVERNSRAITEVAARVLAEEGLSYPVQVNLGNYRFPKRDYRGFTLPEGDYDALQVVLGEGRGQNWWCVLFPPLCFSDLTGIGGDGRAFDESEEAVEAFAGGPSQDGIPGREPQVRQPMVKWYFAEVWHSLRGNLMMALSGNNRS